MAPLPEFRLIGSPVKIKVRGVPIATYYQHYRLPPDRKVKRAPCCRDKQLSQRRAVKYVESSHPEAVGQDGLHRCLCECHHRRAPGGLQAVVGG